MGNSRNCIVHSLSQAAGKLWPNEDYELFDVSLADLPGEQRLFGDKFYNFNSHYPDMGPTWMRACQRLGNLNYSECSKLYPTLGPKSLPEKLRLRLAKNFDRWDVDHLEDH